MSNFGVGLKWSKRFWQYWASSAKQQSPIWKINTSGLKRATNLHLLQKCWNQCWSEKNLFNLLANIWSIWSKITKTTTFIEDKPQYFFIPEFLDFYLFDKNVKTASEKRRRKKQFLVCPLLCLIFFGRILSYLIFCGLVLFAVRLSRLALTKNLDVRFPFCEKKK